MKGATIYLLTHNDAPTFKVVATSLDAPSFATAQTVTPPSKDVVLQIGVAADGLYVRSRLGGFGRIAKVALGPDGAPGASTNVALPFQGSINAMSVRSADSRRRVRFDRLDALAPLLRSRRRWKRFRHELEAARPVDMAAYTSSEVQARSADGTMVPMSLVYRRGLVRNGSHPVDLEGYGAYGITEEPGFSTTRVAWLERGGSLRRLPFSRRRMVRRCLAYAPE